MAGDKANSRAVNRRVVGSSPASGAINTIESTSYEGHPRGGLLRFAQVAVLVAVGIFEA